MSESGTRRACMRRLRGASAADAVCLIHLDHFEAVDDSAGHAAGDAVLSLRGCARARERGTGPILAP